MLFIRRTKLINQAYSHCQLLWWVGLVYFLTQGLKAEKLEWGDTDQLSYILQGHPEGFDLVLGADICFQQANVPLLFDTVEQLLKVRGGNKCKFILAYVSRAKVDCNFCSGIQLMKIFLGMKDDYCCCLLIDIEVDL